MNVHVIVAPSPYNKDLLKYRRHRLVDFLLAKPETEQVIWICPDEQGMIGVRQQQEFELLADGIFELRVFDFKGVIRNFDSPQIPLLITFKKYYGFDRNKKFYLWYTYPAFAGLIKLGIWEKVIYDCSDLWNHMKSGLKTSWFHSILSKISVHTEKKIIEKADICFTSSVFLFNLLSRRHGNVVLIENGVDYQRFHEINNVVRSEHHVPTAGFIGGLKPWKINFKLLANLAIIKRDWNIAVIGPMYGKKTEEITWLMEQPNVTYTPYVPYEKVPEIIQSFDVGLLPYLENDYNQAVFPLKLFEYLAAGVPVVGCGLPSTISYIKEHIYLHVPSRAQDVITACESLMSKRNEYIAERKELARQADWKQKFEMMWHAINQ